MYSPNTIKEGQRVKIIGYEVVITYETFVNGSVTVQVLETYHACMVTTEVVASRSLRLGINNMY